MRTFRQKREVLFFASKTVAFSDKKQLPEGSCFFELKAEVRQTDAAVFVFVNTFIVAAEQQEIIFGENHDFQNGFFVNVQLFFHCVFLLYYSAYLAAASPYAIMAFTRPTSLA